MILMRFLRSLFAVLAVCGSVYAQSLPSGQSSPGRDAINPQLDLALQSNVYVKVQLENYFPREAECV